MCVFKYSVKNVDRVAPEYLASDKASTHTISEITPEVIVNRTSKHIKNLKGMKFGLLTVISFEGTNKWNRAMWLCRCSCGTEKIISGSSLIQKDTLSCGCYNRSGTPHETHGLSHHPLYSIWVGIKNRCLCKNSNNYKNYGGRGIKVCDDWVESASSFIKWASNNGWEKGLQIDRRDNDRGYSPGNCRFVTSGVNIHNRRCADNVGVHKDGRCESYMAQIWYRGKSVLSRNFKTFNAAATARNNFIIKNNLPHQLTKLKETQMDINRIVEAYVACRDKLAEVRKEFKEVELSYKSQMAIMETAILGEADAQDVESFKTQHGTAFKTKKDFISVENWPAALDHMIANDLTHLLTKSVGKAAAKEYMAEHGGALPPGLKYGYIPAISIRRK